MSLYFVRHGKTDWNLEKRLQGQTDIPLNDLGKAEAKTTRALFKDIKMDAIYCSPLKRAVETATIINSLWNLEIQIEPQLIERCFGELEGTNGLAIDFNDLWSFKPKHAYRNLEDSRAFYDRVDRFVLSILEQALNENILLVAHGGVGIPIKALFANYREDQHMERFIIGNCEILEYDKDAIAKVIKQNKPLIK